MLFTGFYWLILFLSCGRLGWGLLIAACPLLLGKIRRQGKWSDYALPLTLLGTHEGGCILRGCWSVLTQNYRLVHAIPDDKRHCPERTADGAVWQRNPKTVDFIPDQGSQWMAVVPEITRHGRAAYVAVTAMIMRLQKAFSSCWNANG